MTSARKPIKNYKIVFHGEETKTINNKYFSLSHRVLCTRSYQKNKKQILYIILFVLYSTDTLKTIFVNRSFAPIIYKLHNLWKNNFIQIVKIKNNKRHNNTLDLVAIAMMCIPFLCDFEENNPINSVIWLFTRSFKRKKKSIIHNLNFSYHNAYMKFALPYTCPSKGEQWKFK